MEWAELDIAAEIGMSYYSILQLLYTIVIEFSIRMSLHLPGGTKNHLYIITVRVST